MHPPLLRLATLTLLGCHRLSPTSPPCSEEGVFSCPGAPAATAPATRVLEGPVPIHSNLVDVAIGDLAGIGAPQLYVGTDTRVTRLDGPGFATTTSLWTSHSGYIYPLIADLTGDGQDDLLLGIPESDEGAGQVVLFAGPVTAPVDWDSPHLELKGHSHDGADLAAADLNGDGALDLVVDNLVRFGPILDDLHLGGPLDAQLVFSTADTIDYSSSPVVGDVTGDGLADLSFLTGGPSEGDSCFGLRAEIRVFPGPISPGDQWLEQAPILLPTGRDALAETQLYTHVLLLADLDADGDLDLIAQVLDATDPSAIDTALLLWESPVENGALPRVVPIVSPVSAIDDFNADGWADLAQLADADDGTSATWITEGPGWHDGQKSCAVAADTRWDPALTLRWVGELDANAGPDIVGTSSEGVWILPGG